MCAAIVPSQLPSPPPSPLPARPSHQSQASDSEVPMFSMSSRMNSFWQSCVSPALRTTFACIIVGVASIHGPDKVRRHVTFPAFSYVVTIMLVGEATLGSALQGTMSAIYGTVLGILPAMVTLYFVKAVGSLTMTTTATVFVMAFVVTWTRPGDVIAKRIALGQVVLIFATSFAHDDMDRGHVMSSIMKPAQVAASTVLGVAAALLALVFPCPRLASNEVRGKKILYMEMAIERLRVLVEGFCAEDTSSMTAFIYQAKSFATASTKSLLHIKTKQDKAQWEKAAFGLSQTQTGTEVTGEGLQSIEMPLKGMEIALGSSNSVPIRSFPMQQDLESNLSILRDQISLKLLKPNWCHDQKLLLSKTSQNVVASLAQNPCDLPSLFFLFCMNLLLKKPINTVPTDGSKDQKVTPTATEPDSDSYSEEPNLEPRGKNKLKFSFRLHKQRIIASLKCSLGLSLAVLFGMLFSKDNTFWSGLTVAITFTPHRESTFTFANLRAQGTLLGSIYGVFGSYISEHLMELRFLVLVPWIIFTGFLRNSRMYGQAGSIAAILSALFILGRRNYGSPIEFSITRLCETFIGLSCIIFVEVVLQPTRASTLAREQLCQCLVTLRECIGSMKGDRKLSEQVGVLEKCISEANSEPNLWFLPFNTTCYQNLHESLCKMVDFMFFIDQGLEKISLEYDGTEEPLTDEIKEMINGDIEKFQKAAGALVNCLEVACSSNNRKPCDIDMGIVEEGFSEFGSLSNIHEQFEKIEKEVMETFRTEQLSSSSEINGEIVLCVGCLGFCFRELMKEIKKMERGVIALIQWENPGRNINLNEIYCKLRSKV